jgi:hypothetical protein
MSVSGTNPTSTSVTSLSMTVDEFAQTLKTTSLTKQLQTIQEVASSGDAGLHLLMDYLLAQKLGGQSCGTIANGKIYQILYSSSHETARQFIAQHFPQGLVELKSDRSIDYAPFQTLLADQQFEEADRLCLLKLCELAGQSALQRKWIYFTEVEQFPATDLHTLNTLWLIHSEGRFGFSVQREIWLGCGQNWESLWPKIGWKSGNIWTRYPQEFTWDLTAPRGHLPLSNQLRGVRVMSALLNHPCWTVEAIAP